MWNDIARSQGRVTGCTIVAVVLTLPHATGASQVSWVAGAGEPGVGDGGSVAAGHKAAARSGAGLRAEISASQSPGSCTPAGPPTRRS